jgi:DNA-directed RNA polymerase subunit alpha
VELTTRPIVKETVVSGTRARYTLGPLEPGFGYTLGNALRRTLLSSIPGAGVTFVQIDGVSHEFSTIPGVTEDVIEIILNLKELAIASVHDYEITASISHKGAGEITGADIKLPDGVEIFNPELHIATCNSKAKFNAQLTIERGRGYVSAEQNSKKLTHREIGNLAVDTVFSPVWKAQYRVEATRVEQRTDFDQLIIDLETKPSVTPRQAIASAASTLVSLFGLIRELDENSEGIKVPAPTFEKIPEEVEVIGIDELGLSTGPLNSLKQSGVKTLQDLLTYTAADLRKIRGMGDKKINEVVEALRSHDLELKPSNEIV